MAVAASRETHMLELVTWYPYPNPALTEVANGPKLDAVLQERGLKVAAAYIAQNPQNTSDPGRAAREGGHPVGTALETLTVDIERGGSNMDRHVAKISVNTPYIQAGNYGRHTPTEAQGLGSSYVGQQKLQRALYSVR